MNSRKEEDVIGEEEVRDLDAFKVGWFPKAIINLEVDNFREDLHTKDEKKGAHWITLSYAT